MHAAYGGNAGCAVAGGPHDDTAQLLARCNASGTCAYVVDGARHGLNRATMRGSACAHCATYGCGCDATNTTRNATIGGGAAGEADGEILTIDCACRAAAT